MCVCVCVCVFLRVTILQKQVYVHTNQGTHVCTKQVILSVVTRIEIEKGTFMYMWNIFEGYK